MTDRFKFRVWIGNKYEEEVVDDCYITYNGELVCGSWFDDVFCGHSAFYEDNEVIVEQCTGLKDKNGKLIYEGDIVKDDNGSIYCIQWDERRSSLIEAALNSQDAIYKAGHHLSLWAEIYRKSYTVIGNIHENEELLND